MLNDRGALRLGLAPGRGRRIGGRVRAPRSAPQRRRVARRDAGASGSRRGLPQPRRHLPVAARPSGARLHCGRPYPSGIRQHAERIGAPLAVA